MSAIYETKHKLAGLVNEDAYPITDRQSSNYKILIEQSRSQLNQEGVVTFPDFIRPEAINIMAKQALALQTKTFRLQQSHTIYFQPQDHSVPSDHPLQRLMSTEKDSVAYADIPDNNLVRQLYQSDDLLHFIQEVLALPALYRHADPLAALNLQSFAAGQQLGWHFDRSDFSVTLAIQAPESGGSFEYVRMLRHENDECYAAVQAFLEDHTTQPVQTLQQAPGTLALFRGHYSLHRVTPVIGQQLRINAVLAYAEQAGCQFTPYARQLFYGRVTA